MLRLKTLNRNTRPFTSKIKVYGISVEVILIAFFILIVLFLAAFYCSHQHRKKKQRSFTGLTLDEYQPKLTRNRLLASSREEAKGFIGGGITAKGQNKLNRDTMCCLINSENDNL